MSNIEKITKKLKKAYPELTTVEALNLAVNIERNELIANLTEAIKIGLIDEKKESYFDYLQGICGHLSDISYEYRQ